MPRQLSARRATRIGPLRWTFTPKACFSRDFDPSSNQAVLSEFLSLTPQIRAEIHLVNFFGLCLNQDNEIRHLQRNIPRLETR
jgi:hypothetical protein